MCKRIFTASRMEELGLSMFHHPADAARVDGFNRFNLRS